MANKIYEEEHIRDIANAIREKNGTQNSYLVSEMGDAIRAIEGNESVPGIELTVIDSGVCGESVHWKLYDNGLLYIDGHGEMYDYNDSEGNPSPFNSNPDITSVIINNGITNIGDDMFYSCYNIKSINIASSVTSIGWYSLGSCGELVSISFPDGFTTIGTCALFNCANLKSVVIPKSTENIYELAFDECDSLSIVYYKGSKSEFDNIEISSGNKPFLDADICYNYEDSTQPNVGVDTSQDTVTEETLGENITAHDKYGVQITGKFPISEVDTQAALIEQIKTALNGKVTVGGSNDDKFKNLLSRNISEITANDLSDITEIYAYHFYECKNLTKITLLNNITKIGSYAFYGCSSIESVIIPSSVTDIYSYAFFGCTNLKTIIIPDSVTGIRHGAFRECRSLTKVAIPDSVKSIETQLFLNCTSIKEYDFTSWTDIPTLKDIDAFSGIASDCVMKVPLALYSSLKSTSNWSEFVKYMVAV